MYFDQFESYQLSAKSATSFTIVVKMVNGAEVMSSAIPMSSEVFVDVLSSLEESAVNRDPIVIWNRNLNQIVTISYDQILCVSTRLSTD